MGILTVVLEKLKLSTKLLIGFSVGLLIAILIGVQAGEKCPITGTWKLIGNAGVTKSLNKGDNIPIQNGNASHWQL